MTMGRENTPDYIAQRLMESCEVDPNTGCWIWTGQWNKEGRGQIKYERKWYYVSHMACWLFAGVPLDSKGSRVRIYETCPPACFNPEHLALVNRTEMRGIGGSTKWKSRSRRKRPLSLVACSRMLTDTTLSQVQQLNKLMLSRSGRAS